MEAKLIINDVVGPSPIQAEGTIAGIPFYFRARWDEWEFCVGPDPLADGAWVLRRKYPGGPYDAGYIEEAEARKFITEAAQIWTEQQNSGESRS